jgi:energy-coupling factor transporter ATP-binding protein EcfA2
VTDRLRSLQIKGMRTIQDAELVLAGNTIARRSEDAEDLTVLIGENGVGKSSFIEALALLAKATSPGFMGDFNNVHGGLPSLLRAGSETLLLRANFDDIAGVEGSFSYELALRGAPSSGYAEVVSERVELSPPLSNPLEERPLDRTIFKSQIWNVDQHKLVDVEVDRDRTLLSVLGIGPQVEDFKLIPDAAGGRLALALKFGQLSQPVLAHSLNARLETVVQRPNPEALADWLKEYDGYGHLRADGRDDLVYSSGVNHHP